MKLRAFSLVELVIVVIIIGIIAAVAVPRLSHATDNAANIALHANLLALRNVIDMYAAEHNGVFPGADGKKDTARDQLTMKTDIDGNIGTISDIHVYGPYLHSDFPVLPIGLNKGASKLHMSTDNPPVTIVEHEKDGWVYNYQTGQIIANSDQNDADGTPYKDY